ncbi:hypothetical protein [Planomonospora sp. ID82291]|nr:hypothetical protein [Planomonospora sp. ID82291]
MRRGHRRRLGRAPDQSRWQVVQALAAVGRFVVELARWVWGVSPI